VAVLPDFQTTYAQGSGGVYSPTASTSWGPLIKDLHNDPTYGGSTVNANTNRDGMKQGMYYVTQRAQAGLDPWITPQSYNNAKVFFDVGKTFNNSLSVIQ